MSLIAVEDLRVHFPVPAGGLLRRRTQSLKAVDGVSFAVAEGEALGIVGESGCGKSTLGRALVRLVAPTGGRIVWLGEDIAGLSEAAMRAKRRALQIIFQDPGASHNPRMTVGQIIAEPLALHEPGAAEDRAARVRAMMAAVGLNPEYANRYPHELSGGQSQRVAIARAMILRPKLVVCDEPVSALDVSTQAQVVNLLKRLKAELGIAIVFISHDLAVVRQLCDRVLVMYLGRVMELGPRDAIFGRPLHPYTRALAAAVPLPDPRRQRARAKAAIGGEVASALDPPSGCVFRTRCPHEAPPCRARVPAIEEAAPGHKVACHFWARLADG